MKKLKIHPIPLHKRRFASQMLINALVLSLSGIVQASATTYPSSDKVHVECRKPENLKNANPEYVGSLTAALRAAGAKTVTCTECYRDIEDQKRACRHVCGNPNGCGGNLCAPPGQSQHQVPTIAVCDISGMPENGCEILKKICDEKYGGKCGIGGYGRGAFHFGVNDNCFSIWNTCKNLPRPPNSRCYARGIAVDSPWSAPVDTGPDGDEGQEMLLQHKIVILAAIAAVGAGAYMAIKQYRNRHR